MALTSGTKLGPYEIQSPLGAGGMGEVYRARDTRLDRAVAIKVSREQFSERFEREARAIAALNHPNICQIYDVGPNYLVMELIDGVPPKGPLPLDLTLRYGAQICDALDAAHKKGIAHRDLKPANILVTKKGVKLLDFGLAKFAQGDAASQPLSEATSSLVLTGKTEIVGTLFYMSPEQLQAGGQEIDGRSDIFSFGLVLYEMLTGKRAFQGSSPASVIAAILERPAPSIADVAPPALDRLLQRCLAKDPDERWQSARDVKAELEWIASRPAEIGTPDVSVRRPGFVAWIAVAATVVAALFGFGYYRSTRAVEQPPLRLSVDLGPDALRGTIAISPDGTRIVFPMRGPDGQRYIATRVLGQAAPQVLPGTQDGTDAFFSPDSQWLGFFADGKLKKIPVSGGTAVPLCDAPDGSGASWGDHGMIVAEISNTMPLVLVPAEGGTPRPVAALDKGEMSQDWPQMLPGGGEILFTSSPNHVSREESSIKVLSLKTGAAKTLVRSGYAGRYIPSENGLGRLVYLHQGILWGVAFDPKRLEVQGTAEPILDDVADDLSVSKNGTWVYWSNQGGQRTWPIVWMDSAGKSEPLVTTPDVYDQPRLSPDGKSLAVAVETSKGLELRAYRESDQSMSRLTPGGTYTGGFVWTPDGKYLIYSSGTGIFRVRADGAREPEQLSDNVTPANTVLYSFSQENHRLAYMASTPETGWDLWTLPFDMSDPEHVKMGKPEPFLHTPAVELEPVFSPDGRWMAYRSDEAGGPTELYVRPFPGPGGKWQISSGGAGHPRWSADGRHLFWVRWENGNVPFIMVVDCTVKGEAFVAGKPHLWSPTPIFARSGAFNYDVAPDGKRLVVLPMSGAKEEKASPHAMFLVNFSAELEKKAVAGGR